MNLKFTRIVYFSLWLLLLVYVLLTESEVLPRGYVKADVSLEYILHILCVALTFSATWMALRLFSIKSVRHTLKVKPRHIPTFNLVRIGILGTAIFFNALIYYALDSSATPLYCLLITLIGFIFCLPKEEAV